MKKKYQRGTDSVDAKLTPREAVLNVNAAEILGRHNIAALNAHGNMLAKRGVDLASDPTPGPSTENMLGYQMGTSMVQSDDRADLLRDADNTFYGGGQAPMPTPTPTPKPNGYQYGSEDVRRRRNAASRYTTNYSPLTTATQGVRIGGQYGGAGATLAPEDNPAYQAAIAKGRTSRSAYTTIQLPSGGTASVPTASKQRYLDLIQPRGIAQDRAEVAASLAASDPRVYAAGYGPVTPPPVTAQQRVQRGQAGAGELASVAAHNILGVPQNQGLGSAYLGFGMRNLSGVVNAASRIGQGIANVFTGGNTQAAPNPNAAPQLSPTPYQTPNPASSPVPSPTLPPTQAPQQQQYVSQNPLNIQPYNIPQNPFNTTNDQKLLGYQYGTADVMPRRYSDYY